MPGAIISSTISHDILPGSSVEIAEHDALDLYGRSSETHRRLRLAAVSAFSQGTPRPLQIPITVINTNPAGAHLPVECEYMIDHMPRWEGKWHARLFTVEGTELPVQEESADMLLLADQWRRKVSFTPTLPRWEPRISASRCMRGQIHQPRQHRRSLTRSTPRAAASLPSQQGVSPTSLREIFCARTGGERRRGLMGHGTVELQGCPRGVRSRTGSSRVAESGAIRTIHDVRSTYGTSTLTVRTISYAHLPLIEYRIRVVWNEERKKLKLSFPTRFASPAVYCEVPAGAIHRPSDGEEYTHGRWMIMDGEVGGVPAALGIVNSGQHRYDCSNGEVRLSILRSAPYCFERTFDLGSRSSYKVMDLGVHEARILVTTGSPEDVQQRVSGLAGIARRPSVCPSALSSRCRVPDRQELLTLTPGSIRLLACKRSWDGTALVIRIQETSGKATAGTVTLKRPSTVIPFSCAPFVIRTFRIERDGSWREVAIVDEV